MEKTTRIPMNKEYIEALGKAVYSFAYYEWTIIYIIEQFDTGYVGLYSRSKTPITSGNVFRQFEKILIGNNDPMLNKCKNTFKELKDERNALIHWHPCTSKDGRQVLNYQASIDKNIHDLQWDIEILNEFVLKISDAEIEASNILHNVLK